MCNIAPLDTMGMANANLIVHNIESLEISQLSIPLLNVAANIYSMTMMIGERAAGIFIHELGISV